MNRQTAGASEGRASFRLAATAIGVVMFASAAPSPLYPLYQRLWGFSSAMLSAVFAVYVGALLVSLLTIGALSDHVGRRPVVVVALLTLVVAMAVFATAGGVGALLVARAVQGLATGVAMGTLSAALVDRQPSPRAGAMAAAVAPITGLAFGVAVSAVLVEYAPWPRRLVFELLAVVLALLVLLTIRRMPETSPRSRLGSPAQLRRMLMPRVAVPASAGAAFAAGVPALIATWALGGLNLSLGPSILVTEFGIANHAEGGAWLAGFFFVAAAAAPLAHARRPLRLPASYACLGVGLVAQLAGSLTGCAPAYVVGLVIAGVGFSTAYTGVIHSLGGVPVQSRGALFAALYVVSYLAFSLPALAGGLAADVYGLPAAATAYTGFVLAMVVLAAGRLRARRRADAAVSRS